MEEYKFSEYREDTSEIWYVQTIIRCVMIYFLVHQLELTLIPAILINCQGNINQVCDR